jgi:hypothetical protein
MPAAERKIKRVTASPTEPNRLLRISLTYRRGD